MKKLSLLFLVMAIFLNGCSFVNANEVKTSALLSYDSTSGSGSSTTDGTENKVCDEKGNCYIESEYNNVDNYYKGDSKDNYDDQYTNEQKCDENGKCWDNEGSYEGDTWNENNGDQGNGDCFSDAKCKEDSTKWDLREIKRMEKEINQFIKKASEDDLSYFKSMLEKLSTLKTSIENVASQDEMDSLREQLMEIQDSLNTQRMAADTERMEKEVERNKKQYEKDKKFLTEELKSADKETKEKINEYLENREKYNALEEEMLNAMQDGSDWEDIDDLRWEMDDLRMTMDDFWQWYQPHQEEKWAEQMFSEMEKDIKKVREEKEYKNLSSENKIKMDELIKIAEEIIAEGRAAEEEGDEEGMMDAQDKLNKVRMKAESLFGRQESKFGDMGFDKEVDAGFDEISEDMSYEKQVEIVKKILAANPDIIKEILEGDAVLAERTMKILDRVPENMQGDFLNDKADLSSLYEEILETNKQIANYKDLILGHNYFDKALGKVRDMLDKVRSGSMSLEDLVSELKDGQLQEESRRSKYENGVISFSDSDYDDSVWYYESVESLADANVVKGKEGDRFAGADRITFAETLKITLERFGFGESRGETSYANAQNHWAKGYYAKAEELGITLLDPDKLITRGEMAKLIVEATLKSPSEHSSSSFNDVDTSNEYFNYIETLKDYEIVSGDSATGAYRPNDNINRAETAKIISFAYETLQFETMNMEEIRELVR